MSLQIREIILFGHNGQCRTIPLRLGAVNIITGPSLRGKSQLIEIIEYCFGRSTPNIAPGPIREKVAWFGLKLAMPDGEILVARKTPRMGESTSERVFIDSGKTVRTPSLAELAQTTNTDGLVLELSRVVGIGMNQSEPGDQSTSSPLTATVQHALLLCLQAQYEIANPGLLFHRQADDKGAIGRAIVDSLPYFLGAVPKERLSIASELARSRRRLRIAERKAAEEHAIRSNGRSRALSLVEEAIHVGLLPGSVSCQTLDDIMAALALALEWRPGNQAETVGDTYGALLHERQQLVRTARKLRLELDEARAMHAAQAGYFGELGEQRARLESIGLFEHLRSTDAPPIEKAMLESLDALRAELATLSTVAPQLEAYIIAKENERDATLVALQRLDESIQSIEAGAEALRRLKDGDMRRAVVFGKIQLFVDSVREVQPKSTINIELSEAAESVRKLERSLGELDIESRLRAPLKAIDRDMTRWATELGHEYGDADWFLDVNNLTVKTHGPRGWVRMGTMGGGKNHLAAHLVAMFAIHRFLRVNNRPVPGFLLLDRPTIGFYEKSAAEPERHMESLLQPDQEYVVRLFDWMFKVTSELSPKLQVIVTEHVELSNHPEFGRAIVENWWQSDEWLVPTDW